MLAEDVLSLVRDELNDDDKIRWTDADLLIYLSSAQRVLAIIRPDAAVSVESVLLTVNESKQEIPSNGLRFIKLVRNMGTDGKTPGLPFRKIDIDMMNAMPSGDFYTVDHTGINEYAFDERIPRVFYVPLTTTVVYVDMAYSVAPQPIKDPQDAIAYPDSYAEPLMEWMKHLAFAVDISSRSSYTRSVNHGRMFFNLLDVKLRADLMVTPRENRE